MITGNRVLIRGIEYEDLPQVYRWSNDQEIKELFDPIIEFLSFDEFVDRFNKTGKSKEHMDFTIVETETKKPIGICTLKDIDYINKNSLCTLYIGDADSRDKGYGSEAMKLLLEFAFKDLNLKRVGLWVFDFNKMAIKCYKKCGMKVEGIMRDGVYRNGNYHDMYFMGILRHEYEEISDGGNEECSEENM